MGRQRQRLEGVATSREHQELLAATGSLKKGVEWIPS